MGHTCEVAAVLRPGIRTFKPRRSRITPRQQRALDHALNNPGVLISRQGLGEVWAAGKPVVMDIGFGSADPVIQLARTFPEHVILAIDVHTPGIGDLVDRVASDGISGVFVMEADALEVLADLPDKVAGVRSFFPDPWPKARHHKRRLAQPAVVNAMSDVVESGGFWHIATDWGEYAEWIEETFRADERWDGGAIDRPAWRPETHFERRAIREGRPITDMWFTRK